MSYNHTKPKLACVSRWVLALWSLKDWNLANGWDDFEDYYWIVIGKR